MLGHAEPRWPPVKDKAIVQNHSDEEWSNAGAQGGWSRAEGGSAKFRHPQRSSEGFLEVQRDSMKFRTTQGPSVRARPLRQEAIPWAGFA